MMMHGEKVRDILREILLGYYYDPLGYSFYIYKFNKRVI